MPYEVTKKYVPPAGSLDPPGEHYTVIDETNGVPWFRIVSFYRTTAGSEVASDGMNHPIAPDGDLFRQVKAAVEQYDSEH